MKETSLILFDLGNVLVRFDPNMFWKGLGFKNEDEFFPFSSMVKQLTREYEIGNLITNYYLNQLSLILEHRYTLDELERAFVGMMLEPIKGMSTLVQKISRRYQIALVSNTNELHYKTCLEKEPALRFFQKSYLSYQLHVMKPSPEYYQAIIQDQGKHPSTMIFIDDLVENIQAAQLAGMRAIQFFSTEKVINDLGANGIQLSDY